MVERLDSAEAAELVAQAFAPGTLVHGLSEELWLGNTLSSGIKPTTSRGRITLSICTAMLPNIRDTREGYLQAWHFGPRDESESNIGFLLSAKAIMEKHPGRLIAIGGTYVTSWTINGAEYNRFVQYGVDQKRGTAFDIPIGRSNQIQFDDEVRLLCQDETETVTPDMWKGIVIAEKSLPYLIREAKKTNFSFDTPVFSTDLELIAPSLAELAKEK